MIKKCLIMLLAVLFAKQLHAQSSMKDSSINAVLVGVNGAIFIPEGDMADRFGTCFSAGLSVGLKRKNNWIYSLVGDYIFSDNVYDYDLLSDILTNDGHIIGADGKFAEVRLYERGYDITMNVAKLIPVGKPNNNSGFLIQAGVGFLQHKIRIETIGNSVPYLDKEYKKGYDKLTNGIALHQFVGYQLLGNKRLINFYAGFDFIQAFTQNRRSFNYDDLKHDDTKQTDILLGFKLGWILPLYKQAPSAFYYN